MATYAEKEKAKAATKETEYNPREIVANNNPDDDNTNGRDNENEKEEKGEFTWIKYYQFTASKAEFHGFDTLTNKEEYLNFEKLDVPPLLVVKSKDNKVRICHNLYTAGPDVIGMYGNERNSPFQSFTGEKLLTPMMKNPSDKRKKFDTKHKIPTIDDMENLCKGEARMENFHIDNVETNGGTETELAARPSFIFIHPQVYTNCCNFARERADLRNEISPPHMIYNIITSSGTRKTADIVDNSTKFEAFA